MIQILFVSKEQSIPRTSDISRNAPSIIKFVRSEFITFATICFTFVTFYINCYMCNMYNKMEFLSVIVGMSVV